MSKTKFFMPQNWMWEVLGESFSLSDLCVYAIIYGFSQDGTSEFKTRDNVDYIRELTRLSESTIRRSLADLERAGHIKKSEYDNYGCKKKVKYFATNTRQIKSEYTDKEKEEARECQNDNRHDCQIDSRANVKLTVARMSN